LCESGVGGVSVDEVSRRSGVAKTTIYRHWKTRSDLLIDACSQTEASQSIPNKGDVKANLKHLTNDLARMLTSARWAAVLPSVIDHAERDSAMAKVHSSLQRKHAAPFREVIQRAIEAGELPRDTDPSVITALIMGPLFYRRWFSREPLNPGFVKSIVERALASV
jgi:AcrR family transcriptional regulator